MIPFLSAQVIYRSRDDPPRPYAAIVTAIQSTLRAGDGLLALSSAAHVHLAVFAPDGYRQAWDVPYSFSPEPHTWCWPMPV